MDYHHMEFNVFDNKLISPSILYLTCFQGPWGNMGPIWGRQGPGGPYVGHINFAIWVC